MSEKLCVVAMTDEESEQRIIGLQRIAGRTSDFASHITIATYTGICKDELVPYVKSFCAGQNSFSVDYTGIGIFYKSCVFAIPRLNKRLFELYNDFHGKFDEKCNDYTSARVGKWSPHTSLCAQSPEKIQALVNAFEEFTCKITGLKIKDYGDGFKEIASFYFQDI